MGCANPIGCTLDSSEMVKRVDAWRAVSLQAISREVHRDGIRSVYPSDSMIIGRLKDLIAAEADCCSFLTFTIQEGPHQTTVDLTFPPEARPLIESVIAMPTSVS